MKTPLILAAILAALVLPSCNQRVPAHWPPSPPVKTYEAHKPWGDNWTRETR